VTARRALTPAARGVSLAVLAALRAGRVDLADQADGSTLATSTAPDGTELLRATLHMPVRGVDTRTPVLPNVSMVPVPAEVPPAPGATPAGEVAAPEAPAPQGATVRCWALVTEWDAAMERNEEVADWLHEPHHDVELSWQRGSLWETALVPAGEVLAELRKVCQRAGITLYEGDAVPPSKRPQPDPVRIHGLVPGDIIEMDGSRVVVGGVDAEGFAWCEPDAKGYLTGEVERCLWREVEHVEGNRWRARPVETETPAAKRAAKVTRTPPARNVPVPEADNLAVYGERSIVAIIHEGGPWEPVWSDALPGHMTYEVAVSSVMAQAHAARVYHRGKRCVRDSRDRGAK
jgi:hypothetical protein